MRDNHFTKICEQYRKNSTMKVKVKERRKKRQDQKAEEMKKNRTEGLISVPEN